MPCLALASSQDVALSNTFFWLGLEQELVQEQAQPFESKKRKAAASVSADGAAGADGAAEGAAEGAVEGAEGAGATDNSGFWCPPFKVRFGFVAAPFSELNSCVFRQGRHMFRGILNFGICRYSVPT